MSLKQLLHISPEFHHEYFWKSDHEICFFRHFPLAGQPGTFQLSCVNVSDAPNYDAGLFNTRHAPLMVARVMHVHCDGIPGHRVVYFPPSHAVSPDRKWIAWHSDHAGIASEWVLASLEGSEQFRWHHEKDPASSWWLPGHCMWYADARRWVELHSSWRDGSYWISQAVVHDLQYPMRSETVALDGMPDGLPIGIDASGGVLMRTSRDNPAASHVRFHRVTVTGQDTTVEARDVLLPTNQGKVWNVVLAPNRERLAWVLSDRGGDKAMYALWVSDVDGTRFKEITTVPLVREKSGPNQTGIRHDWPQKLAWRPDNRHLSFIYQGDLWLAAVV